MTLLRIPLDFKNLTQPSFEGIGKLKGCYGIECLSLGEGVELFLFIEDRYFHKLIEIQDRSQIDHYLYSFGLKKESFDHIELINNNFLKNKNIRSKNVLLYGIFDFSTLVLSKMTKFNNFEKSDNHLNPLFTGNKDKNVIFDLVTYLDYINFDFIIQLFTTYIKKEFYIGGQIVIFSKYGQNFFSESINETIKKILSNSQISFKNSSKFFFNRKLTLNHFLKHIPGKWFSKSSIIINEVLKIPNLELETKFETEIKSNSEAIDSFNLNTGLPIGFEIVPGLKNPPLCFVTFEELTSHFCCFGMTAQGKSRLMYSLLSFIEKTEKNFLVIDPKGEYFEALASSSKPILYFKVGSYEFPLAINIFSIPEGVSVENHIQFIYSLLLNIMGEDVTPQMNRILFKAIENVIETNGCMYDFVYLLEHPEMLKLKGSYLELSGGAVLNRILPLIIGPSKNCFLVKNSSIDFGEIILKNVIVDLSAFELIENKISRKIFVNTFLHNIIHSIKYKNSSIREVGFISNFIIVEEIQKIAPLTFQGRNEINSFIGLAPWTVRAYGICMGFVGTDPNVESPIITNTGLSFIFYTKSNVENVLKLIGISYTEYNSFLSEIQQRKKFLICYKGKITLAKSFDFQIPTGTEIKNRYNFLISTNQENLIQ